MSRALGDMYAGVFANDDAWRDTIVAAGEASGDYVWPFPLHPRYRRLIDSAFADMKNSSLRGVGGPIYATSFLQEFAGDGPWAHVDMAGPGLLTWSRGDYLSQVGRHRLGRAADRRARRARCELRARRRARADPADRSRVRRGARSRPIAEEIDREHRFPYEIVEGLAELGLMGLPIPERWGGAGGDTLSYAIAIEELARIDSSVAITVAAHTSLGTMPILLYGTDEQRAARGCRTSRAGKRLAAFGLTEPGAGSDAGATQTTAELRDGEWVDQRLEDLHHERGHGHHRLRDDHRAHRRGRDLEHHRPERHAGLRHLGADAEDGLARVRHARALVLRTARCPRRTCSAPRGEGLPPVPRDPRRRPHLRVGDGRRACAGRVRPRDRLREGAAAVRAPDRRVPGGAVQARRHGDRDRRRRAC